MEINKPKIPKIKLSNLVKSHYNFEVVREEIVNEFKKIPKIEELKLNPELTKCLMGIVEQVIKPSHKIDKKNLVIQILTELFALSEDEQVIISKDVDFIHINGLINSSSTLLHRAFKFFFP